MLKADNTVVEKLNSIDNKINHNNDKIENLNEIKIMDDSPGKRVSIYLVYFVNFVY